MAELTKEELEILTEQAKPGNGLGALISRDELRELLRVYQAVVAAPEADGFHYSRPPMRAVTGVCFDGIDLIRFAGKRVRLVATSGGGSDG